MLNLQTLYNRNIDAKTKRHIQFITQLYMNNGFECWIVGGPVRDLLLGGRPHDIDFATSCPLEKTKAMFKHVIPTGEDHGTLTIHIEGENYEVTRYRKDVETDGRRATVEFSDTIQEDVLRRDLTVNAIAYNPVSGEIVDAVGGLADIANKVLRFVGNTHDRILEDHLRFIRLLRFKVRLGFELEETALEDARQVFDVGKLSLERIYDEFNKILSLRLTKDQERFLIYAMNDMMDFDFVNHDSGNSNRILREIFVYRSLFPIVYHNGWIPELKLSIRFRKMGDCFAFLETYTLVDKVVIKRLINKTKKDYEMVETILRLHGSYYGSNMVENLSVAGLISRNKEPVSLTDLNISGTDLMAMGIKGKDIGLALNDCLEGVYFDPSLNTFEKLQKRISSVTDLK